MKINPDAKWVARIIAEADDGTQAEIFNELGRIFPLICNGKDNTQMENKILAVVKFNEREALVFEKPLEFIFKKYGTCIIGTDNSYGIFLIVYGYDRPSENWEAFAGRKFDIKLEDGEIEHCYGQWWDTINEDAKKIIGTDIICVTNNDIETLRECYVFHGCYAYKDKYRKLRETYNGKIYEYWDYEKVIKQEKTNERD